MLAKITCVVEKPVHLPVCSPHYRLSFYMFGAILVKTSRNYLVMAFKSQHLAIFELVTDCDYYVTITFY